MAHLVETMAYAVAEGAKSAGADVTVKRVPELVPEEVARASHYKLDQAALIAKPAASSLALFTRKPDDSLCMVVLKEAPDKVRLRCALMEAILVLMVDVIARSLKSALLMH